MEITDIIDYFKDPSNYPIILIFLSGYVITSLLAGKSRKWKSMNQMEKLIASMFLGVALDLGIVLPPILVTRFWQGNLSLDFNSLLQQTSMYFTLFGGTTALFLRIYEAPSKKMLKFLRGIFRLIILSFVILFLISICIYFQMLGYPDYLRIYMVPIWSSFLVVSLLAVVLPPSIYYFVELLFITPLLKEGSVVIAELSSKQSGIRKVTKLSCRDQLMLWAPSRRTIKKTMKIVFLSGLVTATAFVIIPFDQAHPFLTPRLQQGIKRRYDDRIMNRIILMGNQRFEEDFTFKCYEMVYIPYNICAPSFGEYPVRKIGIESPSKSSKNGKVGNPTSPSSWSDVEKMWATSIDAISSDFVKSEESRTIERVWVDWSNLTKRFFSFNITHYQVVSKNVSVDVYYYTDDMGNQTLESYCFLVKNLEKTDLIIPRIDIERLCFTDVILNSTCIFRNEQKLPQDVTRGYVYPYCFVPGSSTVNLTISFYSRS